jgi:hypothetical protein
VTDYLLFIVCAFILVAAMRPVILSRVGRSGGAARREADEPSLHD